ncbi:MAG: hypothetical protein AMJ89_04605 [candidate division Zixibacteria bacterium SM23_73]|nr:MAG: hypothetical protein AMJ89_04605 [candidate division Zixibacteria bacterium SM23_73]
MILPVIARDVVPKQSLEADEMRMHSYESIVRELHKLTPPLVGGGKGEGDGYAFIRIMSIYLIRLL